ncbi:MAG: NBR1-Ig-like domain-containing protein [Pelolinea sp.]|nr:NBR1-Ig-like domain-containing protein [Pelolinea sp.]
MKIKKIIKICLLISFAVIIAGCGTSPDATPTIDPVVIMTDVAGTIQAEITQAALLTPSATLAPPPTTTPLPIPALPIPSAPTSPAGTSGLPAGGLPAASPDNALFIEDVTVPDGSIYWPGERFTKTWKIENIGTTTWNTGYQLVYWDGTPIMCDENDKIIFLTQSVDPNNQITLSVRMTAPDPLSTYSNYFKMINDKGQPFGPDLSVVIKVGTTADKTPTPSG